MLHHLHLTILMDDLPMVTPEAYKNTRPTNEAMQFTSVCGLAKGRFFAAKLSPFRERLCSYVM